MCKTYNDEALCLLVHPPLEGRRPRFQSRQPHCRAPDFPVESRVTGQEQRQPPKPPVNPTLAREIVWKMRSPSGESGALDCGWLGVETR